MKVKLDEGAFAPTRAHSTDAGLDIYSPYKMVVLKNSSATIDTGVHVEIPKGFVGMLKSKSGLNVNFSITSEGVIDSGYTGSIKVKLYNHGMNNYVVSRGDKISQLVVMPCVLCDVELVEDLAETERGENGFGSTGK